jgi:hypothetical protein
VDTGHGVRRLLRETATASSSSEPETKRTTPTKPPAGGHYGCALVKRSCNQSTGGGTHEPLSRKSQHTAHSGRLGPTHSPPQSDTRVWGGSTRTCAGNGTSPSIAACRSSCRPHIASYSVAPSE